MKLRPGEYDSKLALVDVNTNNRVHNVVITLRLASCLLAIAKQHGPTFEPRQYKDNDGR